MRRVAWVRDDGGGGGGVSGGVRGGGDHTRLSSLSTREDKYLWEWGELKITRVKGAARSIVKEDIEMENDRLRGKGKAWLYDESISSSSSSVVVDVVVVVVVVGSSSTTGDSSGIRARVCDVGVEAPSPPLPLLLPPPPPPPPTPEETPLNSKRFSRQNLAQNDDVLV
ncbi:hypothetical protein M0804_004088 [Polistes exclamans]|nr:hypothetical protein M0804_004088 [Polistes exclamans]